MKFAYKFSSIKARLTGAGVGIVVVALMAVAAANFMTIRVNTMEAINSQLSQILDSQSRMIAEWAKVQRAVVSSVALNAGASDILPFLRAAKVAGASESNYIGYADKRYLFEPVEPGLPKDYDPTARPWYQEAMRTKGPILTAPYVSASNGRVVVTFAEPAKDGSAVAAIDVMLDAVVRTVASIKPTPHSYGILTDGSGMIIAHPDSKLALKPLSDNAAELSGKALQELVSSQQVREVTLHGRAALLRASRVEGTEWILIVALDKEEATAALSGILTSSLVTAIGAAGAAALVLGLIISRILRRMDEVRDALEDIASGDRDLTRRLDAGGSDELSQIARAFNNFADQIASVLVEIRQSSDSVKVAAKEIAAGNLDLSTRTEHQAGSLQETASAMEELTSTVKANAENARQANKLAESASAVAVQGGSVVSNVISTMNDISAASQKISDIIGVIDGIAFQTNILALNAAVEAARAGEQGRGFAVVASEVRNLAQRSAGAAKEIKELIGNSVGRVEAGSLLVNQAGQTMDEVLASVQRVTGIMREILGATEEQSAGIEQVNLSIGEMDSVTQQNAALVEEAAAAAGSLQQQATVLADVVGAFKLDHAASTTRTGVALLN
ncbi:methyl-accepting chemotaxis protein [Massilia sp. METH4]|uniref:methyl-accepting chemotaxis protein n=1 Tax=Massilia sp. METH4 TaxID=3123041 RepID=UPI0030CE727B